MFILLGHDLEKDITIGLHSLMTSPGLKLLCLLNTKVIHLMCSKSLKPMPKSKLAKRSRHLGMTKVENICPMHSSDIQRNMELYDNILFVIALNKMELLKGQIG